MKARTRNWAIFWIVVVLAAAGAVVVLSGVLDPRYESAQVDEPGASSQQVLARGEYLARAGDCTACHTSRDGAPFAGGVPIETPFGTIYGTNITPDKQHGIGRWTSADFYRALHDGIAPGHPLYPAMPYTTYRGMTREDSDAIFAYLQSLRPAAVADKPPEVPFPFNLRFLMRGWNLLFLTDTLPDASQGDSAEWTRGRYLTNALGHCTECHTPRGALGQLKLDDTFQGGELGVLNSPDITPRGLAARGWSTPDLQRFLALGIAAQGSAYGDMFDAFHHSTRYLNEADNKAMVRYLAGDAPLEPAPLPAEPQGRGEEVGAGRSLYLAMCAGCHAAGGEGKPNVTVALKGNSTLRNTDAHNLIHVILAGVGAKAFPGNQGRQAMPGFAHNLDDREVAELANYLRLRWGGQKADVQPGDVAARRGRDEPG